MITNKPPKTKCHSPIRLSEQLDSQGCQTLRGRRKGLRKRQFQRGLWLTGWHGHTTEEENKTRQVPAAAAHKCDPDIFLLHDSIQPQTIPSWFLTVAWWHLHLREYSKQTDYLHMEMSHAYERVTKQILAFPIAWACGALDSIQAGEGVLTWTRVPQ